MQETHRPETCPSSVTAAFSQENDAKSIVSRLWG
jgi:hypothetical protein